MTTISKSRGRLDALRREFAIKVQQVGLWQAARLAALKLLRKLGSLVFHGRQEMHPFDLKYGTETSGIVDIGKLDMSDDRVKHAVRYQTAIVEVFLAMLGDLAIVHDDFVLVDLGSGKGRALLLASRFPFSAIIGVELSPTLHEVACRNIEKFNADFQRCRRIRSVCADAGSFELPPENLVIYLFNPFDDVVMREVAANVAASLEAKPRQVYVLYLKPAHRHIWDNMALLTPFKETGDYVVYRTAPGNSQAAN